MEKEQISIEQIRKDLKNIKQFNLYKNELLKFNQIDLSLIENKTKIYNTLIQFAPVDFQFIYYKLYVDGLTLESLAEFMCYSFEYVAKSSAKIAKYFYSIMNTPYFNL